MSKIFNIYFAYPTNRDDECEFFRTVGRYTRIGTEIQAYLLDWEKMEGVDEDTDYPRLRLYLPASHELFVYTAYKKGFITKSQIQETNLAIIDKCDLVIYYRYGGCHSGIIQEAKYARDNKIPIYTMPDISAMSLDTLKLAIRLIIKSQD